MFHSLSRARWTLTIALLLGLGVVALLPFAAHAADRVTSNLFFPIGGTVFHPPSPCMPGGDGEAVQLDGRAHVVTQVVTGPASRYSIHVNLAGVAGTGETTGLSYRAVGAARVKISPGPPDVVAFSAAFDLVQAGACETVQGGARVAGDLTFDREGHLLESTLGFGGVR